MRSDMRSDAAVVLAGLSVAVASARRARAPEVTAGEERVFRWFNEAPDWIGAPAWPVMQAGSLGAVAVTAAALSRSGRRRAAAWTGLVGTAVWAGVKVVKPLVGRGRPEAVLDGVRVRGQPQTGLGYPSGHAAVVMTLVCLVAGDRTPLVVVPAIAAAGVVGATRLYVGAHLPLDVVGGVAIGAVAGCGATALRRRGGLR